MFSFPATAHAGRLVPAFTQISTVNVSFAEPCPPGGVNWPCSSCPVLDVPGANLIPVPSPTPGPLSPNTSAAPPVTTPREYCPGFACADCVDPASSVSSHHDTASTFA